MAIRVAINGFGRIGRNVLRAALDDTRIEFVAVNDLTDAKTLAHLLRYDSVHGVLDHEVTHDQGSISVAGRALKVFAEKDWTKLPWKDLGIDIVLESSGVASSREGASKHVTAGAKRVVISAPAKGPDITVVMGVNERDYDREKHTILSNASCTTNCLAPIAKVLQEHAGIVTGLMTTIHSYTNDQRILDLPHSDLRRARAAALSMIPTTTGAAAAVGEVLPSLRGKFDGIAIRVPTPNVSLVDLTATLEKATTAEGINAALTKAAEGPLKGILKVSTEPLVSTDFNGDPHSSIVDAPYTKMVGDRTVKILSWYDNEWGYSCRVADLIRYIGL
ncbi:MAG: type I glyceraldehyde-3-phosphate dehydrogenase [Acidobacteriota bacterium]